MKKRFLFGILTVVAMASVFAYIAVPRFRLVLDLEKDGFDIGVFTAKGQLEPIPEEKVPGQNEVTSHYALKITDPETKMIGEVRYTLYKDIKGGEATKEEVLSDINQFLLLQLLNAFGRNVRVGKFTPFNEALLKEKTKGDFGGKTLFEIDSEALNEYCSDWRYAQVEYFYKAGQGLVIRTFLFNKLEFAGVDKKFNQTADYAKSPISHVYWSFLFQE